MLRPTAARLRPAVLCAGMFAAGPVAADWARVDDVAAVLKGARIHYPGVTQIFAPDGETYYGPSIGRWAARDGRYCSVWPPVTDWVCYGVLRDGHKVRFIAPDGTATDGTLRQ